MIFTHVPVKALVWLQLDEDGNVIEAELSGDTSWITLAEDFASFSASSDETSNVSGADARLLLNGLVERDKWRGVELTLDV